MAGLTKEQIDAWNKRNQGAFQGLLNVNQFVPVTGDIQSGIMAGQDVKQGNYGSAALNALGLLPFIPALGGVIAKNIPSKTQFETAQEIAQRNAALPVSEGGLGLPASNTAMDRAKAMGFDTKAYHSTNNDIPYFIPSDVGTYGPGVYTAKRPEISEEYFQDYINSNTMPLLINKGKEKQFQSFSDYVGQKGKERNTFDYGQDLRNEGYNSLSVKFFPEGEVREYASFNPSDIRSVNAAFDPFRRNESDILAGVAAAPVGLLAVDKEKKKKQK